MRRFGGSSVASMMERLGVDESIPIEHNMVSKAIENAQKRVEGHNFDLRKHILEYDDVVNQQRQVIYDQRRLILSESNLKPIVMEILDDALDRLVSAHEAARAGEEEEGASKEGNQALRTLHAQVDRMIHLPSAHTIDAWAGLGADDIRDQVLQLADQTYDEREQELGQENMHRLSRLVMLRVIDSRWDRHLTALDELREGIGLRAFGQRNPLIEYKREAFDAFELLLEDIKRDIASLILNVRVERQPAASRPMRYSGASGGSAGSVRPTTRRASKVGRNDPCPCGSGKKYKHCCLRKGLSPEEAAASARSGKNA